MYYIDYEDPVFLKLKLATKDVTIDYERGEISVKQGINFKVGLVNAQDSSKEYIDFEELVNESKSFNGLSKCIVNFMYRYNNDNFVILEMNKLNFNYGLVSSLSFTSYSDITKKKGHDTYYIRNSNLYYKDKLCDYICDFNSKRYGTYCICGISKTGESVAIVSYIDTFIGTDRFSSVEIKVYNRGTLEMTKDYVCDLDDTQFDKDEVKDIEKFLEVH